MPFEPRFTATPLLQRQLVAIERTVGFLDAVDLHPEWSAELRSSVRVEDALSSVQIEGATLSLERAFELLRDPPRGQVTDSEQEFLNHLAAFDAIDGLRGERKYEVSRRDLLSLQAILVRGVRGGHRHAGKYREEEVVVGDQDGADIVVHHQPPAWADVPGHVEDLLAWLTQVKRKPSSAQAHRGAPDDWLHPVLVAGIAQHRMVWIHPFVDGNGRSARMLTTLLLYQRGYDFKYLFDLSSYYNANRDKYYASLRTADVDGDYTAWLQYFVGGFALQMTKIRKRAEKIAQGLASGVDRDPTTEEPGA